MSDILFTPPHQLSEMVRYRRWSGNKQSLAMNLLFLHNHIVKNNPKINAITDIFPLEVPLKEAQKKDALIQKGIF
jgi:hypothetical protein